jgi:hypothetical protein
MLASRRLADNASDPFYHQKIGVAAFYAHHILTSAAGLAQSARLGEEVMAATANGLNDVYAS